jgi:hypothetical protein
LLSITYCCWKKTVVLVTQALPFLKSYMTFCKHLHALLCYKPVEYFIRFPELSSCGLRNQTNWKLNWLASVGLLSSEHLSTSDCTKFPFALVKHHCATSQKVAGAIPDGVTGIFYWHNPSGRTMVLGSIHPLKKWVPRIFLGGKGSRCVGLTTLPPSWVIVLKPRSLIFLEPSGPVQACNGIALPLLVRHRRA